MELSRPARPKKKEAVKAEPVAPSSPLVFPEAPKTLPREAAASAPLPRVQKSAAPISPLVFPEVPKELPLREVVASAPYDVEVVASAPPLEFVRDLFRDTAPKHIEAQIAYPKLGSGAIAVVAKEDLDEEGLLKVKLPLVRVLDDDDEHRQNDDKFSFLLRRYRHNVEKHVAALEERELLGKKLVEDEEACWVKETRFVTEMRFLVCFS
jgi:hypothetical protein